MDKLKVFKAVVETVTLVGTSSIVGAAIKNNAPKEKKIDTITHPVAGYAIGGLLGHQAAMYLNRKIDKMHASYKKIKADIEAETKK